MGEILEEQYKAHLYEINMGTTVSDWMTASFTDSLDTTP